MYFLLIKYYIISIYILLFFVIDLNSFTVKNNKYKKFVIEDNKLCSEVSNRKVELKKDREEAALITQSTTRDHSADWKKNLKCKFTMQSDSGLFAVIQSLNFRKNATTGDCIDYIKFDTKKSIDPKQLCGNWNIVNNIDNYFNAIDTYGYIETTIFISKEKLKPDEKMDLRIVYTRFKRCDSTYNECIPYNNRQCIHNDLFNDSFVNCPFNDCYDETNCYLLRKKLFNDLCTSENCYTDVTVYPDASSTKIILSAVTSLVVSFGVFIICIWICKKTGKLCWSTRCNENTRTRQPSRVIEMQNRNETSPPVSVPVSPAAPDLEKDLPPSYDSLFPER